MKRTLLSLAVLVVAGFARAEDRGVEGFVLDVTTNQPISGAEIDIAGRKAVTGEDGRYRIELPAGSWELKIQAPGYLDQSVSVTLGEGESKNLTISMSPRGVFEESIEVRDRVHPERRASDLPVSPNEVFEVAGAVDNVFRALGTFPGVAATDDFGSRLSVRGGSPDQNLTVLDGVEIHNPFRLFGFTSAFNPETIERFDLTAGGFGAKYGDRLSSLLLVESREGRDRFAGSSALSFTDANVVLEGSMPGRGESSWLVSARRTYYDLFSGRFQDFPTFADLQGRAVWEFGRGHRFSVSGLAGRERTDAEIEGDENPEERARVRSQTSNYLASARFDALLGGSGTSSTIIAFYENGESIDFNGQLRQEAKRSNAVDDSVGFGLSNIMFDRDVQVRDFSIREEIALGLGRRHVLDFGAEFHRLTTGVRFTIEGERSVSEANGSSINGGAGLPDHVDSLLLGNRGGLWVQDRYRISPRLSLESGLRIDWSTVNGGVTFSPRFSARCQLGAGSRLLGALGLFTQSPGYEKLVQADYFVDLSTASDLTHERSLHVIAGYERDLSADALLRVEAYYKRFNELIIGRLETEEERQNRIARYDFPPELQGSIPTDPMITSFPSNDGAGTAVGVDVFVAHHNPAARLTGWVSYTLGKAEQRAYDTVLAFDYDRRHAFNAVGRYRLTDRWDVSLTARLSTGFPRTPPVGLVVTGTEDEHGRLSPERDREGNYVYVVDFGDATDLNSGRLPSYARLDVRATYRPRGLTGRWSFYVEILNAFNRDNAVELEQILEHDPTSPVPRVVEQPTMGFPILPNFGVRFRF